jgi:hypothetical protein
LGLGTNLERKQSKGGRMKTDYQSALARIKSAPNVEILRKLDKSLVRLWEAGIFTESEFSRLDRRLVDRMIAMED